MGGTHIHFMGVGGIGVSALAEMALHSGCTVSGCDRSANALTRRLETKGMVFQDGHDPAHAAHADLLVYSSAIPGDHPERLAAGDRQMSRGEFLAGLMDGGRGAWETVGERASPRQAAGSPAGSWGIAGTHGKTTTAWLTASLAIAGGLDPAVFIGGVVSELPGGNHRLGGGPFIAELDESDATFLRPRLDLAVITNIESEHLRHYRTEGALFDAFRAFAAGVSERGLLVAGFDNRMAREILDDHKGRKLSFGFSPRADVTADDIGVEDGNTRFTVRFKGESLGRFALPLPGRHNVLNALASLGAALSGGVDVETAKKALSAAKGVERRLERLGDIQGAALYSDYAHHPTEVAASLEALRQRHPGRILVVFQPHLYSRTGDYHKGFGDALAEADEVVVADIYPAREDPVPGVTARLVVDAASAKNPRVSGPVPLRAVEGEVMRRARGCDAVVLMGAGDIDGEARKLARAVESPLTAPANVHGFSNAALPHHDEG